MGVFSEIPDLRQIPNEPQRRWFTSDDLDLIIWSDDCGRPIAFQLSYDKGQHREHTLTWNSDGFSHRALDDGESGGGKYKRTPVLTPETSPFPAKRVAERFAIASANLPGDLAEFVKRKLREHPNCGL